MTALQGWMKQKKLPAILLLLTAVVFGSQVGCRTVQPHIVTKVIIQHEGVAAEASAEWN